MENLSKIDFLNTNSRIYSLTLSDLNFYFLVLNVKEQSSTELIKFLMQENKVLISKPVENDENSFSITTLNEEFKEVTDSNKELIKDLILNEFGNKYACLVNVKGDNLITFNVEGMMNSEEDVRVQGVILSQKEADSILDLLNKGENLVIGDFKEVDEIDKISSLFFEEENVKVESKDEELEDEEGK